MSCPIPMKSFFQSISLTSSPINLEECLLSFHQHLFVSLLHPLSPSLVCLLQALILFFCQFFFLSSSSLCFFSISLSLPLSFDWKKMLCHAYFKPKRDGEGKCCRGFEYTKLTVGHQGSCWVSVVHHHPYILAVLLFHPFNFSIFLCFFLVVP